MSVNVLFVIVAVLVAALQASGDGITLNLNMGTDTGHVGNVRKLKLFQAIPGTSQQDKIILFHDISGTSELGTLDMSETNQGMLNTVLLGQINEMQGELKDLKSQVKNLKIDNCLTKNACCNKTIPCPSGYEWFCEKPDMCYKFSTDKENYTDARSNCSKSAGGRLAMPKDKATHEFLIDQFYKKQALVLSDTGFWIGLTDHLKKGTWVWEDGTPLGTGWNNWDEGMPDGLTASDCGNIGSSYFQHFFTDKFKWSATRCDYIASYVCEVKATAAP